MYYALETDRCLLHLEKTYGFDGLKLALKRRLTMMKRAAERQAIGVIPE